MGETSERNVPFNVLFNHINETKRIMNKKLLFFLLPFCLFSGGLSAQEKYGKTLNLGVGATYYGYVGRPSPVIMLNYEIDLVKNVTLAPFIGFFTYTGYYNYWYGPGNPKKNYPYYYYGYDRYKYTQTVIPFGVKGTYYFDDLLNANKKWDFYAALSLGFAIRSTRYEDGYYKDDNYVKRSNVYADLHIGTEYHINETLGVYADASIGMLTVGLSVHHK